jgi:acyl-CoA synthetase (AMP-forming)/AMP-acid ligase II
MRLLAVLAAGACLLSAEPLTQAERDAAVAQLQRTAKLFKSSVKGLTPEQWKFKQAADRWSAAEVAEHITLSEDTIFGASQSALKTPAKPHAADAAQKDAMILKAVPERSQKVQAPEVLKPTNKWPDPKAMLKEFDTRRKKTINYVKTTQDDLRAHFIPHPILGPMDGYQWLLMLSAHSERHTNQILEVKADSKFPKK